MTNILLFAEDPGASNVILGAYQILESSGYACKIFSTSIGTKYLSDRGVESIQVDSAKQLSDILSSASPKAVIVGVAENRESIGLDLIKLSQTDNIPVAGYVDSSASESERFAGKTSNPFEFCPDVIFLPCPASLEKFKKIGAPGHILKLIGNGYLNWVSGRSIEHNTKNRDTARQTFFGQSLGDRKVITFVTEKNYYGDSNDLFPINPNSPFLKLGGTNKRTTLIFESLLDAIEEEREKYFICLRLHPKDHLDEYKSQIDQVDYIDSSPLPFNTLFLSDLTIGLTTSLLVESLVLGTPSLSILPSGEEKSFLGPIEDGLIPCITSPEEIGLTLRKTSTYERIHIEKDQSLRKKLNFVDESNLINTVKRMIHPEA